MQTDQRQTSSVPSATGTVIPASDWSATPDAVPEWTPRAQLHDLPRLKDAYVDGCPTSQQHVEIVSRRISAEVKITDSTFCFTQSQHTDSEPCGPNTDPANTLKCRRRVYVIFSGEWAFEVKSGAGIAQSVVCWARCPA